MFKRMQMTIESNQLTISYSSFKQTQTETNISITAIIIIGKNKAYIASIYRTIFIYNFDFEQSNYVGFLIFQKLE